MVAHSVNSIRRNKNDSQRQPMIYIHLKVKQPIELSEIKLGMHDEMCCFVLKCTVRMFLPQVVSFEC